MFNLTPLRRKVSLLLAWFISLLLIQILSVQIAFAITMGQGF